MCKNRFQRTGRLCGKCLPGFSPLAFSYNLTCVNCTEGNRNLWKYFLISLTPLTCFYFIILFFKISITSSHLHGYIIFAQAVSFPAYAHIMTLAIKSKQSLNYPIKFLASLFTIWNLDFFRMFNWEICLNMTPLSVRALDYTIALYPFVLSVVSYVLIELHGRNVRFVVYIWRPFRCIFTLFRRNWHIRTSIIDAYATFFQLSCFKILCISFDLLIPTYVYTVGESQKSTSVALYYDGTVDFFQSEHLPYAILALSFLFVFTIIPVLLLLVYPCRCFQLALNCCHLNFQVLREFMDSIYRCYKDGTEPGTKDCRWFAALDIVLRLVMFLVYSCTRGSLFFPLGVVMILLIILSLIHIQPYKKSVSHYSKIDLTFYCLLGLYYSSISASDLASVKDMYFTNSMYIISLIVGFVPLLYITCLSLHWIFTRARRMCWSSLISRIRARRRGYQNIEDSYPHRLIHPGQYEERKLDINISKSINSDTSVLVTLTKIRPCPTPYKTCSNHFTQDFYAKLVKQYFALILLFFV